MTVLALACVLQQYLVTTVKCMCEPMQVCSRCSCCTMLTIEWDSMGLPWEATTCSGVAMHPRLCWLRAVGAAGGQWQTALELFRAMDGMGLPRDAITYSSVISALAKGKQWAHALQARHTFLP